MRKKINYLKNVIQNMYLLYRKIKINDYIKYMPQDEQKKMLNLMNSISIDTNVLL